MLGAGGFIGTNLCLALGARGLPVTGFGRAAAPPPALAGLGTLRWRQGDVERLADPDALVAGHSHLFDLIGAGLPNSSNDNPAQIVADGMPPRIRLLDACRRQGVRRIVFASSGGTVYGPGAGEPIAETAPTDPISAYGIGKLAAEKYLALYHHLYGLEYRVLRIANAYGPHQHPLREQGVRDYVHIADVVSAMLLVAFGKDGAPRLFNVGSGIGRSVGSVIADAARVTGRPARLVAMPSRSADVAVNVLDSLRLRQQTGWSPAIGWEAGLAGTAHWLQRSLAKS